MGLDRVCAACARADLVSDKPTTKLLYVTPEKVAQSSSLIEVLQVPLRPTFSLSLSQTSLAHQPLWCLVACVENGRQREPEGTSPMTRLHAPVLVLNCRFNSGLAFGAASGGGRGTLHFPMGPRLQTGLFAARASAQVVPSRPNPCSYPLLPSFCVVSCVVCRVPFVSSAVYRVPCA
jgi:hypothetical protein